MVEKSIFRAYDIRGIWPDELDEETAYRVGRAVVIFLGCNEVLVGSDMRESSPKIFESLASGITDQGANVIDIGHCSTPLFYFGTATHEAGIMVTASHNPAKYNGFKLCKDGTVPIGIDSGLADIRDIVVKGDFPEPVSLGDVKKKDIMDYFIQHNLQFLDKSLEEKRLKIAVDTGNGMGGFTFPKVMNNVNVDIIPLFFEIDMTFPNHEANPVKLENVRDLQKAVVSSNADFGVAIDGDCDRCVFIDEKGEYISADIMGALIAKELLITHPGAKVLYDIRSSRSVKEIIEEHGGKTSMCRVGHAFIKKQMRDEDALFAGELSGHFYYKESYVSESSIISTIIVINMLRREGKKLSEMISPLKRYFLSGEINSEVDDKEGKMKELLEKFEQEANSISHLDGIRVEFDDWWFNVRLSNTESLIRLNLEAKTKDKMEEMRDNILKVIRG
ncbi:phosphomannomutase/phosphoglucomutase [Candidatus Woesearchaeota archaeon]|nr:phosphomannomutase/phosphoglucomutase [Candidatus Woesearchaeota archaeon]